MRVLRAFYWHLSRGQLFNRILISTILELSRRVDQKIRAAMGKMLKCRLRTLHVEKEREKKNKGDKKSIISIV